jgi:hypothetical protein
MDIYFLSLYFYLYILFFLNIIIYKLYKYLTILYFIQLLLYIKNYIDNNYI